MTPEMISAQKYCADRDVEEKKAQYAVPARQETLRAFINSSLIVGAVVVGMIAVLKHLNVADSLVGAGLLVLAGIEGIRRWKK